MTLTFWYRHCDPGDFPTCGLYIFYKQDAGMRSSSVCWSLWIENNGIYWDNPHANPPYGYPVDFMLPKYRVNHHAWRHIAFALDAADDTVAFYVDGELALRAPWGSRVAAADCGELPGLDAADRPGNIVALGHQFPGYTYGQVVEMHDARMYVGSALAPDNIQALARASTPPPLKAQLRCYDLTAPEMQDTAWSNAFGQTCSWLADNRGDYPGLCALPAGLNDCPIACQTRQECFNNKLPPKVFWTWDRIRLIGAKAPNGTVCIASSFDARKVVADCRQWVASGGLERDWLGKREWLEGLASADAARINVTSCDMLQTAIDTDCAFSAEAVEDFTEATIAGGGDYTVAFWMKPVGNESLDNGRFFPQAHFMASLSPPQHNFMVGKTTMNSNGESRVYTACFSGTGTFFEYTELKAVSADDWVFVAFTRDNTSAQTLNSLVTNLVQNQMIGEFRQCFYNSSAMFSSIEFNYPMLVSPIMLVPEILPLASLQQTYYSLASDLEVRYGPTKPLNIESIQFGQYEHIPIQKQNYLPRMTLVATPIVFQQRVLPTLSCPSPFSGDWIREQHAKVVNTTCAPPYQCPADVIQRPELTISCAGPLDTNGTYFGLDVATFDGQTGFAELLFSLTDYDQLYREGVLMPTTSFFDSLTTTVQLLLVFFTPQYGITSVLTISATLGGPDPIDVTVDVEHFEIVEGVLLLAYIVILTFIFAALVAQITYVRRDLLKFWSEYKTRHSERIHSQQKGQSLFSRGVVLCIDITSLVLVPIAVAKLTVIKLGSASLSRSIVGGLSAIPWDSSEVPMTLKKQLFFSNVETVLNLIRNETSTELLLYVAFLVNIFRIMQGTSLHPRLALLEGTLSRAADDLWHTVILIILVLTSFAAVGTWRFGSVQHQFGTLSIALQTELKMMIEGSFFEGWDLNMELQIFTILFLITVNILILNFLLAVVVNAYMDIRSHNKEQLYVQEFVTDIIYSLDASLRGKYCGWPTQRRLGEMLGQYTAKLNFGYDDLLKTNMFRNPQAVCSFLNYYTAYSFLAPATINKFGKQPAKKEDHMATDIERRIAKLIGTTRVSLRDEATRAISTLNFKRQSSAAVLTFSECEQSRCSIERQSLDRLDSSGYEEQLETYSQAIYDLGVAARLKAYGLDVCTIMVDAAIKKLGAKALLLELGAINPEDEQGLSLSYKERRLLLSMMGKAKSGEEYVTKESPKPLRSPQAPSSPRRSTERRQPALLTGLRRSTSISHSVQPPAGTVSGQGPAAAIHLEFKSMLLAPTSNGTGQQYAGLPPPDFSRDRSPSSSPRQRISTDSMVVGHICFDTPRRSGDCAGSRRESCRISDMPENPSFGR